MLIKGRLSSRVVYFTNEGGFPVNGSQEFVNDFLDFYVKKITLHLRSLSRSYAKS